MRLPERTAICTRWESGSVNGKADLPAEVGLLLFLRAGVQPTLDPCAEAFCDRPIALTQERRSLVDDVCECVMTEG